jgi:hypothetical protein
VLSEAVRFVLKFCISLLRFEPNLSNAWPPLSRSLFPSNSAVCSEFPVSSRADQSDDRGKEEALDQVVGGRPEGGRLPYRRAITRTSPTTSSKGRHHPSGSEWQPLGVTSQSKSRLATYI